MVNDNWKKNFFNKYFDENLSVELVKEHIKCKNRHLSEPLYQYTKVEYAEDLINDKLMFMRTLDKLNDPLEGDLKCDFENMIKITLDNELYKNFSEEQKELIKSDYKKAKIEEYKISWENVKEFVSLACFCESYNINPMWAHYADNHSGICVGYNFFKDKIIRDFCFPVYYVDVANNTKVCMNLLKNLKEKNRLVSQLFLKKGKDWSYEKEWRIVIPNNLHLDKIKFIWKNRKKYLKFLKPESVYLGYNINDNDEKYLKAMCRDYDITVYKMINDDTMYNLKAKEI